MNLDPNGILLCVHFVITLWIILCAFPLTTLTFPTSSLFFPFPSWLRGHETLFTSKAQLSGSRPACPCRSLFSQMSLNPQKAISAIIPFRVKYYIVTHPRSLGPSENILSLPQDMVASFRQLRTPAVWNEDLWFVLSEFLCVLSDGWSS